MTTLRFIDRPNTSGMIPQDNDLTPQDLANRRQAQRALVIWTLGMVGLTIIAANTDFLNNLPALWRGLLYLAACFIAACTITVGVISLITRYWRMVAITAGSIAATLLFLVVAGYGKFGPQFPRSINDALAVLNFK